ncbi:MAG: flagellar basal-body rod protein FlgG [Deltaproteobacteria bacterium]|nr:flagellar basal-body rod protein FlgG [Deltaproteobacteria bacterium]MBI3293988.1 flagellar basal-body rod protein FlgG [Deltaproteobacteria bacterium]
MVGALKTAASGMEAQLSQIDHISNNIANVNTTGYKRSRAEFQDLLYETTQEPGANTSALTQSPLGIQRGMGVRVAGTQRNFEMGAPTHTQRDLDMLIRGEGFFVVQLPNGQAAYRRDGTFHKAPSGRVETVEGYPLLPEVTIPPNAKTIQVSEEGAIHAVISEMEKVQIGQVQLATFVNNGGLKAMGKNLYLETAGSGAANLSSPGDGVTGHVMQHFLESSNVEVMREMTDMIAAQRAYEMNSKVIQTVDQMLQHTVNVR